MKQNRLSFFVSGCILFGGLSGVALAVELEEITVTAQKREQSANEIGMSISAFSGETLKELNVRDTADLTVVTPGLTYADVGSGPPIYTLRGVGFNEQSLQATSTVGIYNDEIASPFPIMTSGPLMDVERVEVLKGPQGTLYGRNTTGGAINFIANKPTEDFEGGLSLGYGSFQTIDAEGHLSGALSDSVRARLAFRTIQSGEGWQESVSRDDELGEQDRTAVRLLLEADLGDSADALLRLDWWSDQSDSLAPQFVEANFQDPGNAEVISAMSPYHIPDTLEDNRRADWTAGTKPAKDMEATTVSLTLNWDINDDLKLTSLTSVAKFEDTSLFNRDGYGGAPMSDPAVAALVPAISLAGGYTPPAFLNNSSYESIAEIDAFSQELRLTGNAESFTWIAGAYFSNDEVDIDRPQIIGLTTNTNNLAGPGVGIQGINNVSLQEADSWAVFAHTEWDLSDNLSLTVGARYTEDEKDFEACTLDQYGDISLLFAQFGAVQGGCVTVDTATFQSGLFEGSLDEDSTSGRIALDYNVNDDALVYVSYSRGFKSGSFPTLAANFHFQFDPVVQEELKALEAGFKWSLADGAAQLNGAMFSYDYNDKQLLAKVVTAFGSLFTLANVPESEVSGFEVDLQWQPVDGLFIALTGSFLDTEIKEFTGFTQDSATTFDLSGSKFPLTPESQWTALVNYEWPMGQALTAFVGGDVSYSDSFQTDYASSAAPLRDVYEIDSYTLLGLRAGVRADDDAWNLMLWGRNVTDEFYASNVYKSVDSIIRTNGMTSTYGVTFSYNWF